jgi:hypothetical protein
MTSRRSFGDGIPTSMYSSTMPAFTVNRRVAKPTASVTSRGCSACVAYPMPAMVTTDPAHDPDERLPGGVI